MTNITLKDITITNIFKIHPAIGIARLGDSPTEFCLAPEKPMGLPTKCDSQGRAQLDAKGQEQPVDTFKDSMGRIKRQAARFRVYVYNDANDTQGRELKIGDTIQMVKWQTGDLLTGRVLDIEWTVYLANKKASWYQFKELQGEHGYAPDHPLRNASITDPTARQRLIIDPGPQTVSYSQSSPRQAEFAKGKNAAYPQSFPPPLTPHSIDTLGEVIVHQQNDYNRLIVLGGYGHSGSFKSGFGEPQIESFANNDGWFDDVSDGPVTANVWVQPLTDDDDPLPPDTKPLSVPVNDPAWVLVGSPSYVPEIENIITLDDIAYDLAVRYMDYAPEIYGSLPSEELPTDELQADRRTRATTVAQLKSWNKNYYPYFWRDIWPILRRPNAYQWVMVFDPIVGGDPHSTAPGGQGNMDPTIISIPPHAGEDPTQRRLRAEQRQFVYSILRKPGQENVFRAPVTLKDKYNYQPPLMPLLFGDNPLDNALPSKFLRLTETQLFILQQWRDGKFINEKEEGLEKPIDNPPPSGADLDQGVLWNTLGGSFCPGGEVCWIIRNPAIYAKPYRIKQAPYAPGSLSQPMVVSGADTASNLSNGLEPGDLTKYGPLPWQSDFNECATQPIDVTYEEWVNTYPASTGDTFKQQLEDGVFWWPAHRPMEIFLPDYSTNPPGPGKQVPWTRSLPQTNAGDLEMVTAWSTLGFIRNVGTADNPAFIETERNDGSDNPPKSGA
jgi:hypothetical protein